MQTLTAGATKMVVCALQQQEIVVSALCTRIAGSEVFALLSKRVEELEAVCLQAGTFSC
jgi:hypothetical protein